MIYHTISMRGVTTQHEGAYNRNTTEREREYFDVWLCGLLSNDLSANPKLLEDGVEYSFFNRFKD